MENSLDIEQFVRIHRSYMVNIARIRQMQPLETGDSIVTLDSGKELKLSRRYKDHVKQRLKTQG